MELKDCKTIIELFGELSRRLPDAECPLLIEALQRAAELGAAAMQEAAYNKACDHSMLQSASGQDNQAKDTLLLADTINQLSPSEVIKGV